MKRNLIYLVFIVAMTMGLFLGGLTLESTIGSLPTPQPTAHTYTQEEVNAIVEAAILDYQVQLAGRQPPPAPPKPRAP